MFTPNPLTAFLGNLKAKRVSIWLVDQQVQYLYYGELNGEHMVSEPIRLYNTSTSFLLWDLRAKGVKGYHVISEPPAQTTTSFNLFLIAVVGIKLING